MSDYQFPLNEAFFNKEYFPFMQNTLSLFKNRIPVRQMSEM